MKSPGTRGWAIGLLAITLLFAASCDDDGINAPGGATMSLRAAPQNVVIDPDDGITTGTSTITATITNESGFPLEDILVDLIVSGGQLYKTAALSELVTDALLTDSRGTVGAVLFVDENAPSTITITATSGALTETETVSIGETGSLPPTASFFADPEGGQVVNMSVTFDGGGSSDPDSAITCYRWETPSSDGLTLTLGSDPSRFSSITRDYSQTGIFEVTLSVSDAPDLDCSLTGSVPEVAFDDSQTLTYAICELDAPMADIAGENRTVTLNAGSVTVPLDGSGSSMQDTIDDPSGYVWDCGNNTTQQGPDADCRYTVANTYTVELTVTDLCGRSDSDTVVITVNQ